MLSLRRVWSAAVGLSFLVLPGLAHAEILSVGSASANFRDKPHEASKIKFSADKFYPVEITEKKSGWVKVRDFEGDEAWVAEKLLAKQATVVITAERVNIREKANTTSDVLFKVERGEVFKIEERKGDWLKIVDAKGDGGWIRSDMTWGDPDVEKKALETETKPAPQADKPTQAKELEDKTAPEKTVEAVMSKLDEPQNLEVLCRAYLQQQKSVQASNEPAQKPKPAAKPSKPADKKKAEKKPAPKNDKKKAEKKPAPKNDKKKG